MQYVLNKYNGNFIFIDSDTFFMKNSDFLFEIIKNNNFIMYTKCIGISQNLKLYSFSKERLSKLCNAQYALYKDIKENGIISNSLQSYYVNLDTQLYNSGVIGIPNSYINILNDVLQLSDMIFDKYDYWCAEENAFSIILQKIDKIQICDGFIYHYANAKSCRLILAYYFNYYCGDDELLYKKLLNKIMVYSLDPYHLKIYEIPYFSFFIEFLLPFLIANNIKVERKSYIDTQLERQKIRPYYSNDSYDNGIKKDIQIQKKFARIWKQVSIKNG
jgi:hypothetical protein